MSKKMDIYKKLSILSELQSRVDKALKNMKYNGVDLHPQTRVEFFDNGVAITFPVGHLNADTGEVEGIDPVIINYEFLAELKKQTRADDISIDISNNKVSAIVLWFLKGFQKKKR